MKPTDWSILALYCAAVLAVALYFRARASRGVEAFFVAGRNLPWWVLGVADVAGYTGGGQGFVMVFFLSGFTGLWLMAWVSWVIWMPLVAIVWAPMWRRLGVVTTGEFIERRYSGRRAAVYRNVYAVYACWVWGLTSMSYGIAWMAATTSPVLGWSPARVILLFGALTLAYSLVAGLFAVAYNDILQFLLLMGGNTVFGLMLVSRAGGFSEVWHKAGALHGTQLLQSLPSGGSITLVTFIALCVQGLFFAGSPFAGEGFTAQRYMAARNERHAVVGQMLNGVFALVIRLIPFILIGLAAAAMFPVSGVSVPASIWGDLVRDHAPSGLFGLLLVSSLAGYMSGISSIGNWAASYLVNDVYRRTLRPHATAREYVRVSRLCTGALLIAAFVCGGAIQPKQLEKWVLFINSSLIVFSLPLAWLKWFWWRTNAAGDMVGIMGAFPAGYVVWFGSDAVLPSAFRAWLRSVTGWNVDGLVPAFNNLERYPFWASFGLLFGLGCACIIGATLLTRPEPMDVLRSFYLKVRPMGWWGPVRRTLTEAEARSSRPDSMRDISACIWGIGFYASLCICLFSFMGANKTRAVLALAASLVFGILFARAAYLRFRVVLPGGSKTDEAVSANAVADGS